MMGAQGAGKGTQAKLLAEELGALHVSTGALLRQSADSAVKKALKEGRLADTSTVLSLLEAELAKLPAGQQAIFDGSPRTLDEAKALQSMLEKAGQKIQNVLFLNIPEAESITRLQKRAREDDNPEAIAERLSEFKAITLPAVNYYRQQGLLQEVDGMGSVSEVASRVNEATIHAS